MPAVALIGLVLVGVWAYHTWTSASAQSLSARGGTSFNESLVGSDGGIGGGGGGGGFTATPLSTNNGWAQVAINGLIAQGYDPSSVEQAIEDFLNGNDLTSAEQIIVNKALLEYGAPPGVIVTHGGGNPVSTPAPTSGNPPSYNPPLAHGSPIVSTGTSPTTAPTYDPTVYNQPTESQLPPSTNNGDGTTTYQTPTGPVTAPSPPPGSFGGGHPIYK